MKDFDFGDFEASDSGLDDVWEDESDTDLDALSRDSARRVRARAEGREVEPDGTRSESRRVRKADDKGPERRKVSTMGDLSPFVRLGSSDMLVHEAEGDIWQMKEDEEEGLCIERVMDEDGTPLKL